jgi:hypothetical protein
LVAGGDDRTTADGDRDYEVKGMSAVLDASKLKPNDNSILAMADRLFVEFAGLPIGTVVRAIAGAHAVLREQDRVPYGPEEVEELARDVLRPYDVQEGPEAAALRSPGPAAVFHQAGLFELAVDDRHIDVDLEAG